MDLYSAVGGLFGDSDNTIPPRRIVATDAMYIYRVSPRPDFPDTHDVVLVNGNKPPRAGWATFRYADVKVVYLVAD